MLPDFHGRLRALAAVVVRVGLNLQPGQCLLIAEPFELQGVARGAEVIVNAVRAAAEAAGCPDVSVIWGDGARLRQFGERADWRAYAALVAANAAQMQRAIDGGAALLFLQSSQPQLMTGLPADRVNEQHRIGWEHFGPVAQQLVAGASNWTIAPAPIPAWANAVYPDLPSEQRLSALWSAVFGALRIPPLEGPSPTDRGPSGDGPSTDSLAAWQAHLQTLRAERDALNARRLTALHYTGAGTDLTVALPPAHVWCTACLETKSGVPFVANLPTEEVFTAPDQDSATGAVRVARPVSYGGGVIDGIELEFARGRVVHAVARTGGALLTRLLATDDGAACLGEVALVPQVPAHGRTNRHFFHPLLDENAANHLALGQAYGFTSRELRSPALNQSLIHVDLPLDVTVARIGAEPT